MLVRSAVERSDDPSPEAGVGAETAGGLLGCPQSDVSATCPRLEIASGGGWRRVVRRDFLGEEKLGGVYTLREPGFLESCLTKTAPDEVVRCLEEATVACQR